ncbi:hypothetical protein [Cellulomonas sp. P24]|uniref:hypothetical protein n=1 Tax=Cellulomonas sp. P24 TaxID=2885206 RepID=UPI00216B24FB|nr:hypothetical protein [Cellulomonas sp. P24]MCR6493623.1 hypothetical protein [Cellulomonas sp. P24]
MSATTFLIELFPPAVRDRWGADLRREIDASGVRSWPDTLVGAARLWLHPSDWPEGRGGETRRVLTVMLFAITAATVLVLRTVAPSSVLTASPRHPATSLWLVPLLVGLALAVPLPPLQRDRLRLLVATATRTLIAPAAAVLVLFALAWSGFAGHLTGGANVALVAYYWLTLGFVACRICVLIARTARIVTLPSIRRLSIALLLIGAGLSLASGQALLAAAARGVDLTWLAQVLALGVLALTALSAGRDTRRTAA